MEAQTPGGAEPTMEASSEAIPGPSDCLPTNQDNISVMAGKRLEVRWAQEVASRQVGPQGGHQVPGWRTPRPATLVQSFNSSLPPSILVPHCFVCQLYETGAVA